MKISEDAGIEDELQFVYLLPISNDECKLFYGNQVKDSMVCVGGNFNEGFCHVYKFSACDCRFYKANFRVITGFH